MIKSRVSVVGILSAICALVLASSECRAGGPVLRWSDNSETEEGFYIYRSTDGEDFKRIARTDADATQFLDREALGGSTYWYRVLAFNSYGESGYTNVSRVSVAKAVVTRAKSLLDEDLMPTVSQIAALLASAQANVAVQLKADAVDTDVLFDEGLYYAAVDVVGEGEIPFVCRVAPSSARVDATLSS